MAAMTGNETDPQAPDSTSPDRSPATLSRRAAIDGTRPIVRWLTGLAVIAVMLIVCLLAWGPEMDFPSQVPQEQDDGSMKSVEINRIISTHIKDATTWLARNWGGMFDGIDYFITFCMVWLEDGLKWIPWPALFIAISALALAMGGWRLALLVLLSFVFIGLMNRWSSAVETIAIVVFSVIMSMLISLPLGVFGARSNRLDGIMRPILDGMQTMPSYVYLVPGILFFGLGYTPAVIRHRHILCSSGYPADQSGHPASILRNR